MLNLTASMLLCLLLPVGQNGSPVPAAQSSPRSVCTVNLDNPGELSDILSNALLSLEKFGEPEIHSFLKDVRKPGLSSGDLFKATSQKFDIDRKQLEVLVMNFKHCNCDHAATSIPAAAEVVARSRPAPGAKAVVSKFAEDVVLHVVLHEMGHALVREFDLPILGNEETLADAFATYYLTTHLPDRASQVLEARVKSWMIEAAEVPRREWAVSGEHNNDARRAYQVAALAVAADADKYKAVAAAAGMSENDIRRARDYGAEIHRSWRRILGPLQMPKGTQSDEARVTFDKGSDIASQISGRPIANEIQTALRSFDWHSSVRVSFVQGDGGAGWSRSSRTITVNSAYVRRFIQQGTQLKDAPTKADRSD